MKKQTMTRAAATAIAGLVALATMAGCPAEPGSDGGSGTVVDRDSREYRNRPGRYYEITIKSSGKNDEGRVSREVYDACQVGDRWPDCKKEAKR